MKTKLAIMTSVGLAAGLVSGCGGGQGQGAATTAAPVSTSQSLNTQKVLVQAQTPSETTTPYTVNAGALTLTDTSDTTEPLNIDGM
jgi:hypothetical protein